MILGATAGFMVGHQMRGSNKKIGRIWKTNGLLMRAIMGGLGYHLINHSLKERDERIRRELLLNRNWTGGIGELEAMGFRGLKV